MVQINKSLNSHADALSKLASTKETIEKIVFVEVFQRLNIEELEVACVENRNDWRMPFYKYLNKGELLIDPIKAKKMKVRGVHFLMIDGIIYKWSFTLPFLRCLGSQEAKHVLVEVHSRVYGEHLGGKTLANVLLLCLVLMIKNIKWFYTLNQNIWFKNKNQFQVPC